MNTTPNTIRNTKRFVASATLAIILALFAGQGLALAADDTTGLYGGGTCSLWQKIKSAVTGVYCGYL